MVRVRVRVGVRIRGSASLTPPRAYLHNIGASAKNYIEAQDLKVPVLLYFVYTVLIG
jgi:hypothetical protein